MSEYNYYIVEFLDGFQLIPKEWLLPEEEEAYWPSYTNIRKYDRAVEQREQPNESWKKYKIKRILGKSSSFQRGKEKLREAEYLSDLCTDSEAVDSKKKRKERARKKLTSSSESENESLLNRRRISPFPKVPSVGTNQPDIDAEIERIRFSNEIPPFSKMSCVETNQPAIDVQRDQDELSNIIPTLPIVRSVDANQSLTDVEMEQHQPRPSMKDIKTISRTLSAIKIQLSTIVSTQKEILQKLDEKGINQTTAFPNDQEDEGGEGEENVKSYFPIKSIEALEEVELRLRENRFKAKAVIELKKIGGKDMKTILYSLMPSILANAVATQYSWVGGKKKKVFANLRLADLIQDVVRSHLPEATNVQISEPIKKWLVKAKERSERAKLKQNAEVGAEQVPDIN